MKNYIDQIETRSFHLYANPGGKEDAMVSITLTMPMGIWLKVHGYLDLDSKGKPLAKGVIYDAGETVEETTYSAGNLIWEQKIRKEKQK